MVKLNTRKLRSLNGRIGRFVMEDATYGKRVHFADRKGRIVMRDLRPWEVKAAKPLSKKHPQYE
jgi:hypothetical protein